ncbi:hypothetical protein IIA16_01555 [bacterium]|nr:hypothetical protein [bacterium]
MLDVGAHGRPRILGRCGHSLHHPWTPSRLGWRWATLMGLLAVIWLYKGLLEDSGIRPVINDGGISGMVVIIFSLPALIAASLFLAWLARFGKGSGIAEAGGAPPP